MKKVLLSKKFHPVFFPHTNKYKRTYTNKNFTLQNFTYKKGYIRFKKSNLPCFTLKFEHYTSLKQKISDFAKSF